MEVAHGRLGRARRPSPSFEKTPVSGTGWLQPAGPAGVIRRTGGGGGETGRDLRDPDD